MSDEALVELAARAGVAPRWHDAFGKPQDVAPDTLRAVLLALGLPSGSAAEIAESREALDLQGKGGALPPLITGDLGQKVRLEAGSPGRFRLLLENGDVVEGEAQPADDFGVSLPAVAQAGYHRLMLGDEEVTLAVAPARGTTVGEVAGAAAWGLSVQLYSLRRQGDAGIGDFAALRGFVRSAAAHGAAAVAISPVHAQFSADPDRFSPYAPSSRVMLNVLHTSLPGIDDAEAARLESLDLIDWPAASRYRLAALRRIYDQTRDHAELEAFRAERGEVLESHARFEALHAHLFGEDAGRWHWRDWPDGFRQPGNREVERFAQANAAEIRFHAWLQFMASRDLAATQAEAKRAGMAVGLIADLAVGTDSGGSHAWSRQDEMLLGLTIGAPPDLLSRGGQSWGLVAFSSLGLRQHGYGAYLEMIRAALRDAGGVRIDHAMGLNRLWVVPEGASAAEGAYLRFPEADLLRLTRLESARHRAVVLGEDLGTVPEGFSERISEAGVLGMRVLWFERDKEERFTPPRDWSRSAAAMTSTHDLATVAGWWGGRDLEWRASLALLRDEAADRAARVQDRALLWQAFRESGAASGDPPPPEAPDAAVDAAARHVGKAACDFVLLPVEDALGLAEQPNLPGTLHEHPNWRRRLPGEADTLLDAPSCAARLAALGEARR